MFTATPEVSCEECGAATIPPYTGPDGYRHEGYYCEACGWTTFLRQPAADDD